MPAGSANGSASLSGDAGALFVPQPLTAGNTDFCDLTRPLSDFREGFPTTWDPNPAQTFEGWRIGPQIRGLHQAKLQHMGYPAELWQPLTEGLRCSCVKTTFETAIRDCPSCHGVGFVPGFNKFLHETYFFDVAEAENFTFSGTTLSTESKPNKIVLERGVNTGTFLTQVKTINNGPIEQDWLLDVQRKLPQGGAVNVEFSTNGVDFYPITYINGQEVKPLGQSMIQLRVTLKRLNTRARSPEFYIVRLRRLKYEHTNFSLLESRRCVNKSLSPGEILVLWDWQQTTPVLSDAQGFVREEVKKIWTAPLDYFDTSIKTDSPEAAIKDLQAGPHPFIRFTTGIEREHIFALTQAAYSEQLHIFSYQSFQARRPQENSEVYNKVRNGCVFPEEITVPARANRTNLLRLTGSTNGQISRIEASASSSVQLISGLEDT